jgi:co-chaperonin GroES (HSP10)
MMAIAIGKHILVRPDRDAEDKVTSFGLVMTDMESKGARYKRGTVVSVGEDLCYELKVDDYIAYDAVQGHDIEIDHVIYRVVMERDVAIKF